MSSHPHERPMLASVQNTVDGARHVHFPSSSHKKAASSSGGSETYSNSSSFGESENCLEGRENRYTETTEVSLNDSFYVTSPTSPRKTIYAESRHDDKKTQTKPTSPVKGTAFVHPTSATSLQKQPLKTMASSSSFHANLAAGLLTPTLASALGISTSGRKWRPSARRQNTSPSSSSSQGHPARLTAVKQYPNGRTSICSITSFESLPEDEVASVESPRSSGPSGPARPRLATSQSSCNVAGETAAAISASEYASAASRREGRQRSSSGGQLPGEETWAKRRLVAMELLETERTFVATLEIINEHYYRPLSALSRGEPSGSGKPLSNAQPAVSRHAVQDIFSNFNDILRLNTELLKRLEARLASDNHSTGEGARHRETSHGEFAALEICLEKERSWDPRTGIVGDLLVTMAPFLKIYSFYVKNFSHSLARMESECKTDATFARFLKETDRSTWMAHHDGRPGGIGFGLGLQAHLLSIVQRIPRYRMLVGELVQCTPTFHRDRKDLVRAYQVIEQVATSINETVRQHELTLQMLGIQRQLVGLTFPLIVPGRSLLKRGTLLKGGRRDINSREFFLFTDCIIYAAPMSGTMADASAAAWHALSRYGVADQASSFLPPSPSSRTPGLPGSPRKRPDEPRRRTTSFPTRINTNRFSQSLDGQQLQFREKLSLQDCTVVSVDDVVALDFGLRYCFEIHSPGRSFAVYAESQETKDAWIHAIRQAREEWQSNRHTLQAEEDSIQAKRDKRRSLLAMQSQIKPSTHDDVAHMAASQPGTPAEVPGRSRRESMPTTRPSSSTSLLTLGPSAPSPKAVSSLKVLEDYNAPVWVPDSLADKCACCSETFGIWRRKHHCRLCGKVVCWACSSRSFLIASYEDGEQDRPARACDPCYDSVFAENGSSMIRPASSMRNMRNSLRPDSEVSSATSGPVTPASSSTHCISPRSCQGDDEDVKEAEVPVDIKIDLVSPKAESPNSPSSSASPDSPAADRFLSPATRIAKAAVADAKLFQSSFLSPRVHAATSGSGTFRLVTPRLTTPDKEIPLASRWADSSMQQPSSNGANVQDYFAGATDGQTELASSSPNSQQRQATPRESSPPYTAASSSSDALPLSAVKPRRKPLSAAARLSLYSIATPSAMPSAPRRAS